MTLPMKLDPLVITNVEPEVMQNKWDEWKESLSYMLDACSIIDPNKKFSTMMAYGGIELQRLYKRLPKPEVKTVGDKGMFL